MSDKKKSQLPEGEERNDNEEEISAETPERTYIKKGGQKWNRNKLSQGSSILSGIVNKTKEIPFLKTIASPLGKLLNMVAGWLQRGAVITDPDAELETNENTPDSSPKTSGFNKAAAGLASLSAVAVTISALFPVLAPIAGLTAAFSLVASNLCWTVGKVISMVKDARANGLKGFALASQVANTIFVGAGSLCPGLLAASLMLTAVFPPVGGVLLAIGIVCAVVGTIGKLASTIFNKIAAKKSITVKDVAETVQSVANIMAPKANVKPTIELQQGKHLQASVARRKAPQQEPVVASETINARKAAKRNPKTFTPMSNITQAKVPPKAPQAPAVTRHDIRPTPNDR